MAMCISCVDKDGSPLEFPTVKELNEHLKSGHKVMPVVPEPPPAPVVETSPRPGSAPVLKPIILGYKYSGACKTCGREVETIILDISTKEQRAVAYCIPCHKECSQMSVIPIPSSESTSSKRVPRQPILK